MEENTSSPSKHNDLKHAFDKLLSYVPLLDMADTACWLVLNVVLVLYSSNATLFLSTHPLRLYLPHKTRFMSIFDCSPHLTDLRLIFHFYSYVYRKWNHE